MPEKGHVFVLRGDLRRLACDHVLVPTDLHRSVGRDWSELVRDVPAPGPSWPDEPLRVAPPGAADVPQSWLVATTALPDGQGTSRGVDEGLRLLLDRVESFVAAAAAAGHAGERARPLLGIPLVGTGAGGLRTRPGAVAAELLSRLRGTLTRHAVDVALVVRSSQHEALCRHWRRKVWNLDHGDGYTETVFGRWRRGSVEDGTVVERPAGAELEQLADHARRGSLVPFFGAGVSRVSGAPTWGELLDELSPKGATELFRDLRGQDRIQMSDPFARAQVIQNLSSGDAADLLVRLRERMQLEHCSLFHLLLANLGARDAITTNYDDGYEQACAAMGTRVSIVPSAEGDRRLVKLHGSVGEGGAPPLLTREQLLEFQTHQGPLGGVLQMLLLTGHLVFVGYSMSDPSLHAAIHSVRGALESQGRGSPPTMATSLQVDASPALAALWDRTVNVLWPSTEQFRDPLARIREKEVLFDLLTDQASHVSMPLLAIEGDAVALDLSDDERELRDALLVLERSYLRRPRRSALWEPVGSFLARYH